MKNIHVIPTDKPTRLCIDNSCNELNYSEIEGLSSKHITNQYIYITSDEKPKDGEWIYNLALNIVEKVTKFDNNVLQEKIILATDPELIKGGVQSIEDEFLEWFVKNSSCEEVIVTNLYGDYNPIEYFYEIIIPRKNFYCGDEVDYDDKCLEQCKNCNDATGVDYGYLPKEDTKQREMILMNANTTIDTRKSTQETEFDVHMKVEQMLHLERRTLIEKVPYPELVKELAEYYKDIKLVEKQEVKKQTAVEWLVDELLNGKPLMPSLVEQAKEIEKQQIIDAYGVKVNHSIEQGTTVYTRTFGEEYYNTTYKEKK